MFIIGSGNFDNSSAYTTLERLLKQLADEIRETFTLDSEKSLYESYGDGRIMANIDIFLTLCKHYEPYPYTVDDLDEIAKWKKDYLTTFDRVIRFYGEIEPVSLERRRMVIAETFDRLYAYVEECLKD